MRRACISLRFVPLLVVMAWLCAFAPAAEESAHIVILHVNDVHGQTLGKVENGKAYGGYARLATMVQQVREEMGARNVLLIHAGDEFSRGDVMTAATAGAANIAILNQIGLSLMVPGNGEFYPGPANLQKRIDEAKFPVVASNVKYRWDGTPLAKDTAVLEVAGVKVGVLGLCFLRKEHPSAFPLKVADTVETAKRIVPGLRKSSDLVVAVDHLGVDEDRKLAAAVSGIDLIVGGHSHTTLPVGIRVEDPEGKSVLIVQAGDYLHYVGRVDVYMRRVGGKWELADAKSRLIPLDASVKEDPSVKALIARMWPTTQPATPPVAEPAGMGSGVAD